MKKIIGQKKYDTGTAQLIFIVKTAPGLYFKENSESLFRKETGEFFLLVSTLGEKTIVPMTTEKALLWSEKSMTVEEYESHFGAIVE